MFHVKLITLSGVKYESDVAEVSLPTLDGEIAVLTDHMPLVSVAKSGAVAIRPTPKTPDSEREFFAISGGVIKMDENQLEVIVDEADHASDIAEAEAEAAHERAKQLKAEAKDEVSLERAQAMVDRTGARLQVANLKHRTRK